MFAQESPQKGSCCTACSSSLFPSRRPIAAPSRAQLAAQACGDSPQAEAQYLHGHTGVPKHFGHALILRQDGSLLPAVLKV